jgi:hypothetical protein
MQHGGRQMKIDSLLKDMYFRELSQKGVFINTFQLNYIVYTFIVTSCLYILKMNDLQFILEKSVPVYFFISASFLMLIISSAWSYRALTNHTYAYFPKAKKCIEYLSRDEICEIEKNEFIIDSLAHCVDHNKKINEYRVYLFRRSYIFSFSSAIFLSIAALMFVIFDMDGSSPRKIIQIEDSKLREAIIERVSSRCTTMDDVSTKKMDEKND